MARRSEQLTDLLVRQVTEGLGAEGEAMLRSLKSPATAHEADSLDRAAAAVHLAALHTLDEMPEHVRTRLATIADTFFGGPAEPGPS
jgi:hypothetical protein